MKTHTIYFRLVKPSQGLRRGEHFLDIKALNFIHAIDRLKHSFGVDIHSVIIETVTIKAYGTSAKVMYDREECAIATLALES